MILLTILLPKVQQNRLAIDWRLHFNIGISLAFQI